MKIAFSELFLQKFNLKEKVLSLSKFLLATKTLNGHISLNNGRRGMKTCTRRNFKISSFQICNKMKIAFSELFLQKFNLKEKVLSLSIFCTLLLATKTLNGHISLNNGRRGMKLAPEETSKYLVFRYAIK